MQDSSTSPSFRGLLPGPGCPVIVHHLCLAINHTPSQPNKRAEDGGERQGIESHEVQTADTLVPHSAGRMLLG